MTDADATDAGAPAETPLRQAATVMLVHDGEVLTLLPGDEAFANPPPPGSMP